MWNEDPKNYGSLVWPQKWPKLENENSCRIADMGVYMSIQITLIGKFVLDGEYLIYCLGLKENE